MTVKTTEIDGNKIRYFEEGTSTNTLLLLHGLGASAERWENVIPLFAKKFRVVVPDLIGTLLALDIVTNQWLIIQLTTLLNLYPNL
jgi:pimeloyl-ACP methyl ester carboxylesterase